MHPYLSFVLGIVIAFICAFVAKKRERNPTVWFIAGLFFSVFALLILLILPSKEDYLTDDENLKTNLQEIQELEKIEHKEAAEEEIPSDKLWYYLDEQNNQCGPMTIQALAEEWKKGTIKKDTLVWNEDLENWKPLEETSDYQLFQENKFKPTS